MDRRIFGLENEYGVTCTLRGQRRLSPDEVARYLFRRVVSWGRSSNVFLENGARLYLDVGSHPEYATPECDSIYDLVVHDKAGERILEQLLQFAEQRLREEGIRGVIYLFKNNTDSAGNSYGCHENYLTSRRDDFGHYSETLIPFFVSRQIYAGAGKVLQTARGAMYCISQRAEHIWEGVSSATTRSRPIINTRDEPHADAERFHELKGLNPLEEQALNMWTHCLEGLEKDPMTLDRECDWVIKHHLIERYRDRHGHALTHPKVALMDLQYHDVSRERGLFYRMRSRGLVERMCEDADIDAAVDTPPQTTRARLRGEFIKKAKERRRDFTVDWVHLKLNDQAQRTVLCKDPFKAKDERVEKLIASL